LLLPFASFAGRQPPLTRLDMPYMNARVHRALRRFHGALMAKRLPRVAMDGLVHHLLFSLCSTDVNSVGGWFDIRACCLPFSLYHHPSCFSWLTLYLPLTFPATTSL
jgi:hypothetical protein